MTVHFSDSPAATPARPDLSELLLKTLRDKAGNPDPRAAVLRVVSPTTCHRPPSGVGLYCPGHPSKCSALLTGSGNSL